MAAALLWAALDSLTTRPVYEAVAQIQVDPAPPDVLLTGGVAGPEEEDGEPDRTPFQLLGGRSLAKRVLSALGRTAAGDLATSPRRLPWEPLDRAGHRPSPVASAESETDLSRVDAFLARLRVEAVPGTRLVNVAFRAYDPDLAARAVNLLGDFFVEQSLQPRFRASREATAWLSARLQQQVARLVEAEEALLRARGSEGLVDPRASNAVLPSLTEALVRARTDRIVKETLDREVRARPAGELASLAPLGMRALLQRFEAEGMALREEQARRARTLGERHPRMLDLSAQIAVLDGQKASALEEIRRAVAAEYQWALAREALLRRELEAARRAAVRHEGRSRRLAALRREVESQREMLRELGRRREESHLESQLRVTEVRVLEPAELPAEPVLPRASRNGSLAALLGLALGVFLSVLLERLDDSVRTPEDVTAELGLPFLGLIPRLSPPSRGERATLPLIVREPAAAEAEAYRLVRTNLAASTNGHGRVILVSSAAPGEGKTTTAANLAAALALNGASVLALDADLRRPALHDQFGLAPAPGLADVLGRRRRAQRVIRPTSVKGLQVLPSGEAPGNPAELLGSKGLRGLLAAQRRRYQWIVIDAPPLLALADAPVLCPLADGLVLVVWAESTSRPAVQRALEQVERVGGRLAGVVLNKVDLVANAGYYGQYYGEYYYSYYTRTATAAAPPAG